MEDSCAPVLDPTKVSTGREDGRRMVEVGVEGLLPKELEGEKGWMEAMGLRSLLRSYPAAWNIEHQWEWCFNPHRTESGEIRIPHWDYFITGDLEEMVGVRYGYRLST